MLQLANIKSVTKTVVISSAGHILWKPSTSNDLAHVFNLDYILIKKRKEIALESTQSQEAATKLKLNKFYQLSKG